MSYADGFYLQNKQLWVDENVNFDITILSVTPTYVTNNSNYNPL